MKLLDELRLESSSSPSNRNTATDHDPIRLRLSVSSHQGGRKYMEDQFTIVHYQPSTLDVGCGSGRTARRLLAQPFVFLGIFDGHGGDMAARYTRAHLCRNIVRQKCFWSTDDDDSVCLAIHRGFMQTQRAMMHEVDKWPKTSQGLPSTSGTTASVLFIKNGKYYTGHVGDSRIVLGRQDRYSRSWQAFPLTRDHKPESRRERQRIEAAGGQVINKAGIGRVVWNRPRSSRPVAATLAADDAKPSTEPYNNSGYDVIPFLSVARSLGDLWSLNPRLNTFIVSPEPDVKCIPVEHLDRCLVLGSDGLWNMINTKAAIQLVQEYEESLEEQLSPLSASSQTELDDPEQSHSMTLLNLCLDRWLSTRFRADNTTVLVALLDQNRARHRRMEPLGHPATLDDFYDSDLHDDCNLIGDTVHTLKLDRFDKISLVEESFADSTFNAQEEDEEEEEEEEEDGDDDPDAQIGTILAAILSQVTRSIREEDELTEGQLCAIPFDWCHETNETTANFVCNVTLDSSAIAAAVPSPEVVPVPPQPATPPPPPPSASLSGLFADPYRFRSSYHDSLVNRLPKFSFKRKHLHEELELLSPSKRLATGSEMPQAPPTFQAVS